MNGPIAQAVAIVCHGNGALRHKRRTQFWPVNSTAKFCDSISFVALVDSQETVVAASVDEWFARLRDWSIERLDLRRAPPDGPLAPRIAASFAGTGDFHICAAGADGIVRRWAARWRVWDENAPRIWRVTYGLIGEGAAETRRVSLADARAQLAAALHAASDFAASNSQLGFAVQFRDALARFDAVEGPESRPDLVPDGVLSDEAVALLASLPNGVGLRRNGLVERPLFSTARSARAMRKSLIASLKRSWARSRRQPTARDRAGKRYHAPHGIAGGDDAL